MENKELQLAWNFVTTTHRNIFLTGKAGTGKTTFLHRLKRLSNKRLVVLAPTGVAAINAKGVTLHSFFQLPFGPILPNQEMGTPALSNTKFSKTKINIIKSLDLLVIDEISMVRADLLDGIDKVLRRFKNRDKIFGGVQLLMIGDLQQLSPVIKESELQLLKPYYKNIFFFSSQAFQNCNPLTIELKHIYRQEDPVFINILNEIRNNCLSESSAKVLNQRCFPDFSPSDKDGFISLTTHNNKARQTNQIKLNNLTGKEHIYKARVDGNFPEHSYPNKERLILKVGAQVMFIKNDSSPEKRYFNGKIGKIISLSEDEVVVKCPEDNFNIVTKLETWENIKYNIDHKTKAISEEKIGSYSQIPLRLAWAITIHKSQGLTFEKAIIDAEGSFAHGQIYVALSRCKSLDGLILKNNINPNQIINDSNVIFFNKEAEANQPDEDILQLAKREFQLNLISEIFDFYAFLFPINRILDIYYKNRGSIEGSVEEPLNILKANITNLLKVGNTFRSQLESLVSSSEIPESSHKAQERFSKAMLYFEEQTKASIQIPYGIFNFSTDNQSLEKEIDKHLDTLDELLNIKLLYFKNLKNGFKADEFLALRAESVVLEKENKKKARKFTAEGAFNPQLFELLRDLRNNIAMREDLNHYQIFTQKSLYAMCEFLPTTSGELKQIHGMGKVRIKKYGDEILTTIVNYCEENGMELSQNSPLSEVSKPKREKGETRKLSLKLFKKGMSVEEIADERELNPTTIMGHLAGFISSGEVKITDLISESHYKELKAIIPKTIFENLSDLKHQLDDKYTYGEIRIVLDELSRN